MAVEVCFVLCLWDEVTQVYPKPCVSTIVCSQASELGAHGVYTLPGK